MFVTVLDDLDAMDALFSDETKWTQNALGRMCDGTRTHLVNAACQWCLSGAAMVIDGACGDRWSALVNALEKTYDNEKFFCITDWNDDDFRTFADVKKLIADTRARVLKCCQQEGERK